MSTETRVCAWCGTELAPWFMGLYCCDSHREQQRRHRQKWADRPIVPCPKPFKIAYTHRGDALRKALEYQQRPYTCPCGCFHLTSKPPFGRKSEFDEPLRRLAEEMIPTGVDACGDRADHATVQKTVKKLKKKHMDRVWLDNEGDLWFWDFNHSDGADWGGDKFDADGGWNALYSGGIGWEVLLPDLTYGNKRTPTKEYGPYQMVAVNENFGSDIR